MNTFNNYYYIYRDMYGRYNYASNPKFIAEHKNCFAVEKAVVKDKKRYLAKLNNTIS